MSKLTLSVNEEVVRRAKRFASGRGTSLSSLVQRYLDAVTRPEPGQELPPILRRLRGSLKRREGDAEGEYHRHLEKKYQ